MPLVLNKRVWLIAERLFIHCHKSDAFLSLLKKFDIEYAEVDYKELLTNTKPLYTFMSEDNYTFANFMELTPSYKYLPLIESIVFDECVKTTQDDRWNYYGEDIKNWYPTLVELLNLAGIKIDNEEQKLSFTDEAETEKTPDFVLSAFGDAFIDYIRKELNESYASGRLLSVMFLSRKLLEVVSVRIMEVVFPKLVNKDYNEVNHALWYDKNRGKYHDFEILLENLKKNAMAFHEDKDLVLEFVALVKPFKNETNACVHNDYKIPDQAYIRQWKIPYLVEVSRKLFRKYCNP